MATPQPGQTWQHWKGDRYEILAINTDTIRSHSEGDIFHYWASPDLAEDEDAPHQFGTFKSDIIVGDTVVIYGRGCQVYARSLSDFTGVVSFGATDWASNVHRFTLVRPCQCGAAAEWLDRYCQDCWERHCAESWHEMLKAIEVCPVGVQNAINAAIGKPEPSSQKR